MKTITFTNDELNAILDALNDALEVEMERESGNGPTIQGEIIHNAFLKIEDVHVYRNDRKVVPISEPKEK
tara:strand:- start:6061 stop:6270 length:210 start_codon:yes stop_codon:yes gene_type:complete